MNDPVILSGNEVISIAKELSFVNANLLKFEEIDRHIGDAIKSNFPNYRVWAGEGDFRLKAEVLQPGKNWQKGKLKLVVSYHVEFTPDAVPGSESPLDDLRSQLGKPEFPPQNPCRFFGNP